MSEEQDCITITIGDGSEDNNSDDPVIIEVSETECTENTVSTDGMLTIQTNFQGSSDNYQAPSQTLHEVEGLAGVGNQRVSEMNRPANLKRCNPNSAEVEFIPLNKKPQLSIPRADNKEGNASRCICSENCRNQLKKLQQCCEGLRDLVGCTGNQVSQLCGIMSRIWYSLAEPPLRNTGDCSPSLPVERQENRAWTNPVGMSLPSAALHYLPKLSPHIHYSHVISSVQAEEPNLANIPEMMNYTTAMGNNSVGPDTALSPYLWISPKLAENYVLMKLSGKEETSLANSSETASLGNTSGPNTACSSSLPPNFGMLAKAQTSVENNSWTTPYPTELINNSDLATTSSSASILPNVAENYVLMKLSGKEETSLANSSETASLGNTSGPNTACSSSLPPNFGMLAKAQTSVENNSWTTPYPTELINNSDLATASSSASILPNVAENYVLMKLSGKEETSLANSSETASLGNTSGPNTACSSSLPPNFGMLAKAQTSVENNSWTTPYPTELINNSDLATASSSASILPNVAENYVLMKLSGKEETSLANSSETASLGNTSGPNTACSSSLPPNFGMLAKAQTSVENNSWTTPYPTELINNSDLATASSSASILPNVELSVRGDTNLANSIQMMNNPPSLENDSGEGIKYLIIPSSYVLIPVKLLVQPETNMENSHGTVTNPIVLENNNNQNSSSSLTYGFLGDPKRNIRISHHHLTVARKKGKPKHAARYLVRVLFSNEVLICSSVGVNPYLPTYSGRQPLDPNKMAAIREYLAAVFPNHDLSECGKDWKDSITYINSLIRYLCSYHTNKTAGDTVVNNQVATNPNTPASAGLNDEDGDSHESSSQLSQQAAASKTRANGSSQQNSNDLPKVFIDFPTDESKIPLEDRRYIGHPSRNIQVSYVVLDIAKARSHPHLSARYLICILFPEDILIKSSVNGNVMRGLYALDPNRIDALREFLEDNYPNCDLRENGYDWKLCVAAINGCIRSLRYRLGKSITKSQPLPEMIPSIKSEQEHTE